MGRVAEARAALAVERKADEAVDRILGDLAELDDDAMERVLERLVMLLGGSTLSVAAIESDGPVKIGEAFTATIPEPPLPSFAALPASVQSGAKELKRLSGLPEDAVSERIMGWIEARGEEPVAAAFAAMRDERPPHEISYIESYLGLE